jgi:hypothetical protein
MVAEMLRGVEKSLRKLLEEIIKSEAYIKSWEPLC